MTPFAINLMLAIAWQAFMGSFDLTTLVAGFVMGYGALYLSRPLFGDTTYFWRLPRVIAFFFYFLRELLESSLRVAYDVMTPPIHARPSVVRVPLDARSDLEITLLANLISLTPGTLSLDVAPDRSALFVHAMFCDDPDRVRADIKNGMERRLLELLR